jgi:hypothetical protein
MAEPPIAAPTMTATGSMYFMYFVFMIASVS